MDAIHIAETKENLPAKLLQAIAYVESGMGRTRGIGGALVSCPWSINVAGRGYTFKTKQEAIAAVHNFKRRGYESIDVGLMQINLKHHPRAFANLDQAFDPATNIAYAARFLGTLFAKYRSWPLAIKHYHSSHPILGGVYLQKIMHAWGKVKSMNFGIQSTGLLHSTDLDWNSIPFASQTVETQLHTNTKKVITISMSFFPLKLGQVGGDVKELSSDKKIRRKAPSSSKANPGAIHNNGRVFPLVMAGAKSKKSVEQPRAQQRVYAMPLAYSTADAMPLH